MEQGQFELESATKVSRSMGELVFADLKFGEAQKFEMKEAADIFQFEGKRRFVKGFTLPLDKKPLSLRIGSFRVGTIDDPAIFYPEVHILDANFQVLRTVDYRDFAYRVGIGGNGLFATVFFNADQANEKYVLITNREPEDAALKRTQDNITSQAVIGVPIGTAILFWSIPTGVSAQPAKMRAAHSGIIEVFAEQYKPLVANAK